MTIQEFLELNESSIGSSGAKWDSCDALIQLNKARSALYGLHNWNGLVSTVCMRTCATIALPWFAESLKSAYRCNKQIHIAAGEYFTYVNSDCCGQQEGIVDVGEYAPVPVANSFSTRLGFKTIDEEDVGRKIKITFANHAGTHITQEITLDNNEFSVTEEKVARVISIKKDSTFGMVWVYDVNPDGVCCNKLFGMYPLETNLKYRLYCLNSVCCNSCQQVVLKVKRKYFPFTDIHYNHQIDFIEHGLSLAMEAIASKDKRTPEGLKMYQELIKSAINYFKINTIKEDQTFSDVTLSHDYPSITDECGCY